MGEPVAPPAQADLLADEQAKSAPARRYGGRPREVTFSFDDETVRRLRAAVPDGQRSWFVQCCVLGGLEQLEREQGGPTLAPHLRLLRAATTLERTADAIRGAAAAVRPDVQPDVHPELPNP